MQYETRSSGTGILHFYTYMNLQVAFALKAATFSSQSGINFTKEVLYACSKKLIKSS